MIKHAPNQYGWTANAKGETVEHEVEQAVIKEMLEWRDSGVGPGGIASCMDARGHRPRRGNRWTAASVRNILDRVQAEADEKAGIVHIAETHFQTPSIPGALDEDFTCPDGSTIRIPKGSAEDMRKHGRVEVDEEPYIDIKTNKIKPGKSAQWSVEDFKDLEAKKLAEERLTVAERAERVVFEDPKSWGNFGDILYPEVISAASLMATAKNMEPLQGMIDRITDQKTVKRDIRNEVKRLFNELAGERQFRLHLLARLQKAEASGEQS